MNIFLTLDYELFFGTNSGTQEECIVNPTNKLLNIFKWEQNTTLFSKILTATLLAYSHILLDAALYPEMHLFWPFSEVFRIRRSRIARKSRKRHYYFY